MVFAWLPIGLTIPEPYFSIFVWLCVVLAWPLLGLTIAAQYFVCFHVALRDLCMASIMSGDSYFYVAMLGS